MELLILFLFAFALRVLFLWPGATDNWLIWYNIANQTGAWLKHEAYNSCIDGIIGSPKLQYYFVSRFPHKYQAIAGNLLNIAYDLVGMGIVYLLVRHFSQGNFSREAAFLATMLYATAPILMPPTARLTGIKARTLGGLLALSYFLCLAAALLFDQPLFYALCGLFSILSVLASAFAMQVILLFSIILSIIYLSLVPLLVSLLPIVLSYFIPLVGIKEIVRHKINHYIWYFCNYTGTTAGNRNNFSKFKEEIFVHRRYNELLYHIFMTQSLLISFYSMPIVLFLAYYIIGDSSLLAFIFNNPILEFSLYIMVAAIIVFVLVSTRYLLFLGEAERYFEYCVPFACILVGLLVDNSAISFMAGTALMLFQLTIACATIFFKYRFDYRESFKAWEQDEEDVKLFELLDYTKCNKNNVLVIPTKYAFKLASLTPKKNGLKYFLYFVSNKLDGFRYMKRAMSHYESLDFDFDYLEKTFDIDLIILVNEYAARLPKSTKEYLEHAYVAQNTDRYTVYLKQAIEDC